jgi:hypothetical protein
MAEARGATSKREGIDDQSAHSVSSSFLGSTEQVADLLPLLSSSSMQYQMPICDARQRPSEEERVGERSARASSMSHFHNAKSLCINGIGFYSCQ